MATPMVTSMLYFSVTNSEQSIFQRRGHLPNLLRQWYVRGRKLAGILQDVLPWSHTIALTQSRLCYPVQQAILEFRRRKRVVQVFEQ
jgi:hypothetical protein